MGDRVPGSRQADAHQPCGANTAKTTRHAGRQELLPALPQPEGLPGLASLPEMKRQYMS